MENSNNQMQNNNHSLPHRPEYIPGRIQDDRYVRIFDTTLRDGEQAPGAAMSVPHKLDIARTLAKLKVDIIEAGFPASSKDSFEATKLIAKEVGNEVDENGYVPVIAACGRCSKADMDTAWEAVRHAKRPRVTTFIATSEIHMKYKLKKSRAEVLKLAKDTVTYTKSLGCKDIGFAAEDAGRSDKDFLFQVYGEVIEAGATTIHLTDTVGYNFPNEIHQFILDMKDNIRGVENAVISIHCHDDLGLANANALAAVQAGARQVDVTINGLGERAGNTALEEFVMAVKCRGKDLMGGIYSGIDTKHILSISKMVEEYTGMSVQANKAIVGANAFAHASGIHQDGVLKHRSTYEIISPEDIGLSRSIGGGIVLGKLSGRNALKSRIVELGYDVDEKVLDKIFQEFKVIAEDKKCVTEEEVKSLLQKALPNFKMAN